MNYNVFLSGVVMLVGACLVACMCNYMKRRKMKKKQVHKMIVTPTISYTIDAEPINQGTSGKIKNIPSPLVINKTAVTATDSTDSSSGLLPPSSPNLLTVPKLNFTGLLPSQDASFIKMY